MKGRGDPSRVGRGEGSMSLVGKDGGEMMLRVCVHWFFPSSTPLATRRALLPFSRLPLTRRDGSLIEGSLLSIGLLLPPPLLLLKRRVPFLIVVIPPRHPFLSPLSFLSSFSSLMIESLLLYMCARAFADGDCQATQCHHRPSSTLPLGWGMYALLFRGKRKKRCTWKPLWYFLRRFTTWLNRIQEWNYESKKIDKYRWMQVHK